MALQYDKYDPYARKELKRMLSIFYPGWKSFVGFNGVYKLTLEDGSKIEFDRQAMLDKRDRLLPVVT